MAGDDEANSSYPAMLAAVCPLAVRGRFGFAFEN